jgi:protein phosphatase-4 regulatory subunit 3
MIDVMHQAEDLENLENLHSLCSLMQTIREPRSLPFEED